jgi:hypothetical protein
VDNRIAKCDGLSLLRVFLANRAEKINIDPNSVPKAWDDEMACNLAANDGLWNNEKAQKWDM